MIGKKEIPFAVLALAGICWAKDLVEECRITGDPHVTRGSFTCCATSPRRIPLEPSLDFEQGWEKCAVEPDGGNEDPVVSAWRVYRCIVFLGLNRQPLTPAKFAEMVAKKYPGIIRNQIVSKMADFQDSDMKFEVDVECEKRIPYPKVHLVRNLFYDIEHETCSADDHNAHRFNHSSSPSNRKSSTPTLTLASYLCEKCDRRHELYHRNGDCCSHVSLPFPFIYLPYRFGNQQRVEDCVADLINDVGLPSDTTFATNLKYLCYPSCEHYLSGTILESDLWSGVNLLQSSSDLRALVEKMMPIYFSPKYKEAIGRFVVSNFRTSWEESHTFDKMNPSEHDMKNCDKGKLKNLLSNCKAHRLVETVTNLYLNNVCQEKYGSSDHSDNHHQHGPNKPSIIFNDTSDDTNNWGWNPRKRTN